MEGTCTSHNPGISTCKNELRHARLTRVNTAMRFETSYLHVHVRGWWRF